MQNALAHQSYDQGLKFASAGRHIEAIACFEQALAVSPADTKVLFALGNTARAIGQPQLARQFYSQVLTLEPGRLEALVNLANLLRAEGQFAAARAILEPALAQHQDRPELHLTMGSAWREEGQGDLAAIHYQAALRADPNYAPALSNLGDLMAEDGDHDAALEFYGAALKAEPGNAQLRLNRAVLLLQKGDLAQGWRDYAARSEIPGKVAATDLRLPEWKGGPLKKARLLVRAEQGVGDEIMFASLFPALIAKAKAEGGSVILECEKRLAPLYARSFPGAKVHAAHYVSENGRLNARYDWLKQEGGATHMVLAGSLPRFLAKTLDDFPKAHVYLTPEPDEVLRWHGVFAALTPSPVTGICWRSGKTGGHRAIGFAPLAAWGEFLKSLPGSLVSAQYDATPEEIAELEKLSGRRIFVAPGLDQKNELDRAAAMLSALDFLVSAPTAVAWLGAACGTATVKILYDNCWTSFGQDHEPLAPACRMAVPSQPGDWQDVFAKARALI